MTVRTLDTNASLDTLWEELIYTEARLSADANASDLAPVVASLLERLEAARVGQRSAWRAEILAQATIDAADDRLDDEVDSFSRELLHSLRGERSHARFQRYFARPPHAVIRLGLATELEVVRPWPASIATEPEASVQAHAPSLAAAVQAGDAAIEARSKAASARVDQRVRAIVPLVDDINGARRSIYGELVKRAASKGLADDWAGRFFLRGRSRKAGPADVQPG